jgi:hypothetical protein
LFKLFAIRSGQLPWMSQRLDKNEKDSILTSFQKVSDMLGLLRESKLGRSLTKSSSNNKET